MFHHNMEIDARDKQIFCFSLGREVQEGEPIISALRRAAAMVPGQRMKEASTFMERGISEGELLVAYPKLMAQFPELDDGLFAPEIGWGEEVGDLDIQLLDLAKRYKQQLASEPIYYLAESQSVSTFSLHLRRSLKAKLPISSSLRSTSTYLAEKRLPLMAAVIEAIWLEYQNGRPFGECLAARPETFSKDYTDLMAEAVRDNSLVEALDLLIEIQ